MIEFIENPLIDNPKKKIELKIDGVLVPAKVRSFLRQDVVYRNINVLELESSKVICDFKFSDFPNLYYLTLPIKFSETDRFQRIYITKNYLTGQFEIKFRYNSNPDVWKDRKNYLRFYGNYSKYIADLNFSRSDIARKLKIKNLKPRIGSLSHKSYAFEVLFVVLKFDNSLNHEISRYLDILNYYHDETIRIFENETDNFLTNTFNFPKEIKFPCEQYLQYFVRFLQDLGINATSNLKEEAGKVLFSVTPTDDVEALEKIREALAVYLKLPESPIVYDDSFAAMRLQQQIENLQHSQKMAVREIQVNEKLLLAQSDVIREKNVTISQQQTVIENQNKIIEKISSKSVMMDSAENKEELEEVYEGVKVGESKWLKELTGIGLNPAKAIKTAVKNTFGTDEKKSILGLNEE